MAARLVSVSVEGQPVRQVASGTPLSAVAPARDAAGRPALGALLNNRLVSLDAPLLGASHVRLVTAADRAGQSIFRRTVSIVLAQAVRELAPGAVLNIGQSLGQGWFFEWTGPRKLDAELVRAIEARMLELVRADLPLTSELVDLADAVKYFEAEQSTAAARLLRTLRVYAVPLVTLLDTHVWAHGPVAPSTGGLEGFGLAPYEDGLVLNFPDPGSHPREIANLPRLFKVYRDTRRWNEIVGAPDVGRFNELCISGAVNEIVRVSEGLHEKKLAEIADRIQARGGVRVVLAAGPSASGKTTFVRRLAVQLRVNGLRTLALSLDDYYVDRERTPLDEQGRPDFEALEAVDLPLLNEHLARLLRGETVRTPRYEFAAGRRAPKERWRPLRLEDGDLLLVEGIHGLNDRLVPAVPAPARFRCYVSALTQLALDNHERIFTSDARLLRRIVRDRVFRGYRADATLDMWPSVRRGEVRHIFPFQEQAEAVFNSALLYEPAVLKTYAERFLLEVPVDSPAFPEADRLLRFLALFVPVFPEEVPQTSILREFIGGSTFAY